MQLYKTEGIALKAVNYKDSEKILTVFTQETGITTILIKKLSLKRPHLLNGTNLFCLSEFIYLKGKSDIYYLKDLSLINEHLFLRKDLNYIEQAALMAKALLESQLPSRKAPGLYLLFKKYILKIPEFEANFALGCSFILKLLLHEGLLHFGDECSQCPEPAFYISKGEFLCKQHAPSFALNFSPLEMDFLKTMALCRSFEELKQIQLSSSLKEKTWILFKEIIS